MFGAGGDAVEHGAQVLPADGGTHRIAGGSVPHHGAGPLGCDTHGLHRPAGRQRQSRDLEHRSGHGRGIEFDQPGEGRGGWKGAELEGCHLTVGANHRGAQAGGADIDHEDAHGIALPPGMMPLFCSMLPSPPPITPTKRTTVKVKKIPSQRTSPPRRSFATTNTVWATR